LLSLREVDVDVLQIIKLDHERIRGVLSQIAGTDKVTERRRLVAELEEDASRHFHIEANYLYPEVSAIYTDDGGFFDERQTSHKQLTKRLHAVSEMLRKPVSDHVGFEKKFDELNQLFDDHFGAEERVMMPRVRQFMPTQEREDLGQVILDVKEELARELTEDRKPLLKNKKKA